jgi:O-acetyl-ADP-ribose deacetylase (regulator of RNase III)
MIIEQNADLLDFPLQGIIHSANCFHTMGSGIAKRIREKYPEAYDADLKSGTKGDSHRLGSYSVAHCLKEDKYIYNLYGQYNFGAMARFTSYDALDRGLRKIEADARDKHLSTLGCPKLMGSDRGGASWRIVRAIIGDVFDESPIDFYVCFYEGK